MIAPMLTRQTTRFALITFIAISATVFVLKTVSASANNARAAAKLYAKHCVSCHGTDGRSKTSKGKYSHARDLTDGQWQDEVSDERLFNSIMNGRNVRGNMPGFSDKLKTKEAESLVTLVRGLRR
jgi:mono/diheme cytochrome c family protein